MGTADYYYLKIYTFIMHMKLIIRTFATWPARIYPISLSKYLEDTSRV